MTTSPEPLEYPELDEALAGLPSKERAAQMLAINMKYAQCFLDGDFDGMEEYVVETPVFEEYPEAVRITGREATRARSERLYPLIEQLDRRKGQDTHRITASAFGEDVLIHEFSAVLELPDGSRRRCHLIAVVAFEGDKMVGERVYSDLGYDVLRRQGFGEDFYALPGVTKLAEEESD